VVCHLRRNGWRDGRFRLAGEDRNDECHCPVCLLDAWRALVDELGEFQWATIGAGLGVVSAQGFAMNGPEDLREMADIHRSQQITR
jgi:hypothetical protein